MFPGRELLALLADEVERLVQMVLAIEFSHAGPHCSAVVPVFLFVLFHGNARRS
jgi:hypothetical protein